ncbi:MAG: hypothetical protein PHZ09_04285 [Eubacteriales bacterium]|nr:hypothetical protein [Eubacteriales bacterium]
MKKIITLLIAAVFVLTAFACAGPAGPSDGTTVPSGETAPAEETRPQSALPESDLDGFTVTFIGKAPDSGAFGVKDVAVEGEDGDAFNDAVYRRNRIIEEKYNCVIEFVPSPNVAVSTHVRPSIIAGDDYFDVIYDGLQPVVVLAQEESLIDLYSLEYFDFAKPWWDQAVCDELSILGALYITYGEHMIGPKSGLYCLFFSKQLAADYNLGDLYQIVRDNKWTMDTFASLAVQGKKDLDGDGKWTIADQYGHVTETYSGYTFMVAQGYNIAAKDENDMPVLTPIDDSVYARVDKMMMVLADPEITTYVDQPTGAADIWIDFWRASFVSGRMLFREGAMHDAPTLRDMDTDFGILPMPKFSEEQDRYYHTNSVYNAAMMCIPVSASDPDTVSFIVEAMAYESLYMLNPVYYEVVLQGKTFRDTESEEMLDIIFASKTFDIGAAFNWGGLQGVYTSICTSASSNFASRYAAVESRVISDMEKTIEIFGG